MLLIWTNAEKSLLKKTIATALQESGTEHQVTKITPHKFPQASPGDVVLGFGNAALDILKMHGLIPKARTVTSCRETEFFFNGVTYFISHDLSLIDLDWERKPEMEWDVRLACRKANTGTIKPVLGAYKWDSDFNDLVEYVEDIFEKTGKPVDIAADLETLSNNPYNPEAWIITLFVTYLPHKSVGIYFNKGQVPKKGVNGDIGLWDQINWIFTSEKISLRGANWKYDSAWLRIKWGVIVTNFKLDTMLVGSLLDENRSNSLKMHTKIYIPDLGGYEDDLKNKYSMDRMDLVSKEDMLGYAGGDTDSTYRVATIMKKELLSDKRLTNFYVNLLHPSSMVFEKMERVGVCVDVPYYSELQKELEYETDRLNQAMLDMIPSAIKKKAEESNKGKKLTVNKKSMLVDYLFTNQGLNLTPKQLTPKAGEPATTEDHLMMFADDPEVKDFIGLLKEYSSATKTLSTFVIGFLEYLRPDGRFHPSYMLHRGDYSSGASSKDSGTVTGRTSAKGPSVQVIPKHTKWTKKLRRAFIAPPGYTILNLDFSQGELRIAACLSEEPVMIDAYKKGMDLHSITAARVSGYEFEDFMLLPKDQMEELRSRGKAGNFGLCLHSRSSVLTKDRGLVRISSIETTDLVWDGEEWVSHDGALYQGWKEVWDRGDLSATPDHQVWTYEYGKVEWRRAVLENLTLVKTGEGSSPIRAPQSDSGCGYLPGNVQQACRDNGYMHPMRGTQDVLGSAIEERGEMPLHQVWKVWIRQACKNVGGEVRLYTSKVQSRYAQAVEGLQRKGHKVLVRLSGALREMGTGNFSEYRLQGAGVRQDRQCGALFSGEPTTSNKQRESSEYGAQRFSYLQRAANVLDGLAKSLFHRGNPQIREVGNDGGADYRNRVAINCKQEKELARLGVKVKRVRVYDIINAGPRRRFTANGYLVSNCYGMQVNGFIEYARVSYGVHLTEKQGKAIRDGFFDLYSALPAWYEKQIAFARKNGYVRSPLGRIRRVPLINSKDWGVRSKQERQVINSPVQATLSDMAQLAMVHIEREYGNCDIHPFMMTHDSISYYVKIDEAVEWAKRFKYVMESLPLKSMFWWNHQLQFIADAEISVPDENGVLSMANMQKLKGL